jgi:hypothetical protein
VTPHPSEAERRATEAAIRRFGDHERWWEESLTIRNQPGIPVPFRTFPGPHKLNAAIEKHHLVTLSGGRFGGFQLLVESCLNQPTYRLRSGTESILMPEVIYPRKQGWIHNQIENRLFRVTHVPSVNLTRHIDKNYFCLYH